LFNQGRKVVNLSEGTVFECEIRFQSLFGSLLTMVDSRVQIRWIAREQAFCGRQIT
jgi:hypothetical protein